MELVTISRMKSFRACPRLHHLTYDLQIVPVSDRDVARFGSMFHEGLEARGIALREGADALTAGLAGISAAHAKVEGADPFELAKLEALFEGYHFRWREAPLRVLAVETQFETPLVNPTTGAPSRTYRLSGKVDQIVSDDQDRLWLVESKTTSLDISPGSGYWQRLRLDGQVSVYFDGAAALGYDVVGCLYDVAKRPAHQPYKATALESRSYTKGKGCKLCGGKAAQQGSGLSTSGGPCVVCHGSGWEEAPRLYAAQRERDETPEEFKERIRAAIAENPDAYYLRGEVVRIGDELDEARADVWHTARNIREAAIAGRHVRNPDACVRFGSTCPYFPVCVGEATIDDESRYKHNATAHPELVAV